MIWTMKDGTHIDIKDMGTQHLKNTIALVQRKLDKWDKVFDAASGYSGNGDAAQNAVEYAASNAFDKSVAFNHILREMATELENRRAI